MGQDQQHSKPGFRRSYYSADGPSWGEQDEEDERSLNDRITQFRWWLAVVAGAFVLLPRELATTVLVLCLSAAALGRTREWMSSLRYSSGDSSSSMHHR